MSESPPTPEQTAACERVMDGLEAQADIWADEINLVLIIKNIGAASRGLTDRMPPDIREGFINRQESNIDALVRQAYLEGFMRGGDSRKAYDEAQLKEVTEERDELEQLFDLQWKADQRAIKRWQKAHPGNERIWPDRADMVVWLMEQHTKALEPPSDELTPDQVAYCHERAAARRKVWAEYQAAQKPVAWLYEVWNGDDSWGKHFSFQKPAGNKWQRNIAPLYTLSPADGGAKP